MEKLLFIHFYFHEEYFIPLHLKTHTDWTFTKTRLDCWFEISEKYLSVLVFLFLLNELYELLNERNNIIINNNFSLRRLFTCLYSVLSTSTKKTSRTSIRKFFLTMSKLDRQLMWFLCAVVTSLVVRRNRKLL